MADIISTAVRDPRAVVLVGIILAYVWRFHVLVPALEIVRISALLTVASWGFLAFSPGGATFRKGVSRPFVVLYIGLLLWAFVGHPFGLLPGRSFLDLKDVHLKNLLFLLFILGSLSTRRRLELALSAHVVGVAVIAFFYLKAGTPTMWTPIRTYDRNDLALLFNMCLPFVVWFGLEHPSRAVRRGLGLLSLAVVFCVVMSQSRGGFLGLAIIGSYLVLTEKTVRLAYRVGPVVVLGVGFFLLPSEVTDRLSTLTSLESDYNMESATGRVEIWKRGLTYVGDRPLFGVGLQNFAVAEAALSEESREFAGRWKGSVAHNSYLEITVETGFVGGLLYLGLIGSLMMGLQRTRRRLRAYRRERVGRAYYRLSGCMIASVLGFAFGSFFLSTFALSLLVAQLGLAGGFMLVAEKYVWRSRRPRRSPSARPPVKRRVPAHTVLR